ncbi:DUF5133 domain-containing protein [Streptomyces sp. NPDC046831]|uniref:DUF5133 domain-containing protein n=1 Tax=Streptomyces sp. NPDC046831 TaxID=3154805 RepID=UPI0033D7479C
MERDRVLMPHPDVLRKLVAEYHAALTEEPASAAGVPGRRAQDLAYTLCVSTGTREVGAALREARRMLSAAAPARASGPGQSKASVSATVPARMTAVSPLTPAAAGATAAPLAAMPAPVAAQPVAD